MHEHNHEVALLSSCWGFPADPIRSRLSATKGWNWEEVKIKGQRGFGWKLDRNEKVHFWKSSGFLFKSEHASLVSRTSEAPAGELRL